MTSPDLSTASISDALDSLGLPGSLHGIGALRPGQRATGPVFTVSYEPVDVAGGTVGDFLDDVPAGSVILIDIAVGGKKKRAVGEVLVKADLRLRGPT